MYLAYSLRLKSVTLLLPQVKRQRTFTISSVMSLAARNARAPPQSVCVFPPPFTPPSCQGIIPANLHTAAPLYLRPAGKLDYTNERQRTEVVISIYSAQILVSCIGMD